jgi:tetratricopeptide (TPR) repeat protein
MEALTAAGGLTQAAFAAINMAEVLISQGRLDEAEVLLTDARRVTRAASYHEGAGFACQQLGRLYARRGDHRLADEHFGEARTEYLSIGYHRAVIEMQMDQIEALLLRGDLNGADSLLAATRPEIDRDELTAKLVRLDALSRVGHGDIDGALDGLTSALATARLVPIERFRILQALLGLGITHCGADLAGWRAERDELASRLCIR